MDTVFIRKVLQMLIISVYLTFSSFNILAGEYETSKEHEKTFDPIVAQKEIQFKKNAPSYNPKQWDPPESYLNKIPQDSKGAFIDRKGNNPVKISPVEAFGKNHSLGFNGTFVKVTASYSRIDGILILPTSKENSGSIDVRRSYIFKWDDKSKRFLKMPRSGVSQDGKYVWSRITEPGDYTVIGMNKNLKVQDAIHSLCANNDLSKMNLQLARKLCKEKFCGDANFPTGSPSLPIDPSLNDICQKCPNLEVIRIPECDFEHIPFPHLYLHKWESLGPFNIAGVITRIELDPNNPDRLYALANPGGLWVLDDVMAYPEKTWRPLTDEQEKIDAVRLQTFTLGSNNGSTVIYLVDIFNNLHRSIDHGVSWRNVGTIGTLSTLDRELVKKIIVNPKIYKELYAATLSGLFVSYDGGTTWNDPPLRNGKIFDAVIDFDQKPIIYAAILGEGIYRYNEPNGWSCIFDNSQLQPGTNETDYFSYSLRVDIGEKNHDGSIQTDKDRLVAVKVYTRKPLSTGKIWHLGTVYTKRNNDSGWQRKGWNSNLAGEDKNVLAINPHDSEYITEGSISLWQSKDGGDQWQRGELTRHDHLSVAFDPREDHKQIVYVSTDGGIFRSRDSGFHYNQNWWTEPNDQDFNSRSNLNKGLVVAPIYRAGVNGNYVLATIDHHHWWGTANIDSGSWKFHKGFEWYPVFADPRPDRSGRFYGFFHELGQKPRLMLSKYNSNGELETKLFGDFMPWTRPYSTPSVSGAIAVDPRLSSNTVLVGAKKNNSDEYSLMATFEGNLDPQIQGDPINGDLIRPIWHEVNNFGPDPVAAIAYDPRANGQAFVITYNGSVYRSVDVDGSQPFNKVGRWELCSVCNTDRAISGVRQLAINNEGILFAISQCRRTCTDDGSNDCNDCNTHDCNRIAFSDNGGQTWNTIGASDLPDSIYHSLIADSHDSNTLYLSTQNGVYISYNSGNTWNKWDEGLPNVEILQLLKNGDRIYAVTYGRGLWSRISGSW
jgi:photosystem II stability/assembly factor-like uncharacterized protein